MGMSGGRLGLAVALVAALLVPASAHATSITGVLDFTFSGSSPSGDPTVTVDDGGVPGSVELTFDLTDLSPTEFADDFYLNFNPAKDVTALSIVQNTGDLVNEIVIDLNNNKADGDGFFDILFDWPPPPGSPSNVFGAGETATFTVTGIADLVATDFVFPSINGPVGKNGFYAAAHIQSIGTDGEDSGWVGVDTDPTITTHGVPEPASVLLLGLSFSALGVARRRSSKSKAA
jgi:PEP-CTERM motif